MRRDAGRGLRRAPTSPSPTRARRWPSPTTLSETAREIGAANTLSFADGEIRADNTDAERPAGRAARLAGGRQRAGARRRRRGAGRGLGAGARGRRGRGLEPDRAALPPPLRGAGREPGRTSPMPADYELIVNSTAVGLGGEDPFEELPLSADGLRPRARSSSTWSTATEPTRAARRPRKPPARRPSTGSRSSSDRARSRFEIWTGREAPLDVMRTAAREDLSR